MHLKKQLEEFEKKNFEIIDVMHRQTLQINKDPVAEKIRQFLITSHISYLEGKIKELEGEMFVDSAQAGQFALHTDGINQAYEDQISTLQEELKEAKELLDNK